MNTVRAFWLSAIDHDLTSDGFGQAKNVLDDGSRTTIITIDHESFPMLDIKGDTADRTRAKPTTTSPEKVRAILCCSGMEVCLPSVNHFNTLEVSNEEYVVIVVMMLVILISTLLLLNEVVHFLLEI